MIVGLDFGLFAVRKVRKVGFGCKGVKDSAFCVKMLLLNHYFDGKRAQNINIRCVKALKWKVDAAKVQMVPKKSRLGRMPG